jgi:hypothetical protein
VPFTVALFVLPLLCAFPGPRAAVTGLPAAPAWYGVVYAVVYYVDDALMFFGMVRLAQIVGEVEEARRQRRNWLSRASGWRRPGGRCPRTRAGRARRSPRRASRPGTRSRKRWR